MEVNRYTLEEFWSDMLRRFSSRKFQVWFTLFIVSTFALFAHVFVDGLAEPVASFTPWATFNAATQFIYSGTNLVDKGRLGLATGEYVVEDAAEPDKPKS